jgi:hypothetical protein
MNSEYERVGEAIAAVMFDTKQAGQPVYALADEGTIRAVMAKADIEGQGLEALSRIVASSLQLGRTGVPAFQWQTQGARLHRDHPLDTPPALPLLVLLSTAAEQMHADGDLAAHNYYSRLHRLLKVSTTEYQRVENDYRRAAEILWGSLNAWLEAWEGERGIPTAYAVGAHTFVGLPMSQAVVRQHDRVGLHELFAAEGMTPGLRISPDDMSAAMDPYASSTPSLPLSSHIARLWRVPNARERIVDAACLELEAWDGSGVEAFASSRPVSSTRLLAFLRTFPRKSIEFNLMLPYRSEAPNRARFQAASMEVVVPTLAGPGGSTRLSGVDGVTASSLVGERLDGRFGEDDSRPFARLPKRATPLRWDDLQGAFVEVERISLGEDSIVVLRSDARQRVEAHLAAHARPGWRELLDLPGMPDGWLIYQHVQMISAPVGQMHFDLLPLAPRARTSLALRGGFVLPGLLRKWSVSDPPEAVALAAGAASISIMVYRGSRVDPDAVVANAVHEGELAVLTLAARDLTDGEYLVAMFVDRAVKPSSTALLRLRSASSPQFRVEDVDIRLVYSPESSPRWPLSAGPPDWPAHVNGARIVELSSFADQASAHVHEFVPRERGVAIPTAHRTQIGIPMAVDSCLITGMHHFRGPRVEPGRTSPRTVEWECETCGLLRRFAGNAWAARKREKTDRPAAPVIVPPVHESEEPDFEVAFDALNHVGTGSLGVFERIAAQVEGSGLFADSFLRRLEVVGHVDVARDDYLRVTEWAVNSSTLVPIDDGRWVLIGSRSESLLGQIRSLANEGVSVDVSVDAEMARVELVGKIPHLAFEEIGITVLADSPAQTIAYALPPLSHVAISLKRIIVPAYRSAEFWDTASASWHSTDTMRRVGAYRLKDFGSTYAIRSPDDVEQGTIGLGNAQIVKHVANLWAGDPLLGYNSRSGSVVTPLGADLPGLYGRALSLCSGRAPREIESHRMLQYPSTPKRVADIIFDRVSR